MSYEDILLLPHPVPKKHKRMDRLDRAAQFAPFAALSGHDAEIREEARLTDMAAILEEDRMAELDLAIRELVGKAVSITYFQPDERKAGGKYVQVSGVLKKIDEYTGELVLEDGQRLDIRRIYRMEEEKGSPCQGSCRANSTTEG